MLVDLVDLHGAEHGLALEQVRDQQSRRQHAYALAPRQRPVHPCSAEHEQRLYAHLHDVLEQIALR